MFEFSYDPDRNLMRLVQADYWSLADFRAFEAEFTKRHMTIRRTSQNYRVLADCRDFPVQSAEISQAFGAFFDRILNENKGRYAIVASSMLNKLQARRALPQGNVQVFSEPDEAMAWLFEDGSLPA
ncbi:STAS/SEC14 domain-containing protein [Sphingobium terrigena]|nr:STAS/SEC14 domain-containing protein [Sphingobium terrigena]